MARLSGPAAAEEVEGEEANTVVTKPAIATDQANNGPILQKLNGQEHIAHQNAHVKLKLKMEALTIAATDPAIEPIFREYDRKLSQLADATDEQAGKARAAARAKLVSDLSNSPALKQRLARDGFTDVQQRHVIIDGIANALETRSREMQNGGQDLAMGPLSTPVGNKRLTTPTPNDEYTELTDADGIIALGGRKKPAAGAAMAA